jgi:hypothetical protein
VAFCDTSRNSDESSDVYNDAETITAAGAIEELLQDCKDASAFCIYDFSTTDGLRFVHEHLHSTKTSTFCKLKGSLLPESETGVGAALHHEATERFRHEAIWTSYRKTLWRNLEAMAKPMLDATEFWCSMALQVFKSRNVDLEADPPNRKLIFQDLFAGGRALTPEVLGTLLGNCYHAPFTLHLVNALCMNESRNREPQGSCMTQIRCPEAWVGKNFGDLQTAWLRKSDAEFASCGALIVLAVYRHAQNDKVNGCSITVPEWSFTLEGNDLLTVLGSKEFGIRAISKKLLRGDVECYV